MNSQTNPQRDLAYEYIRSTNKSLFLTGKAGSGKTTFLHQIRQDDLKRMAVVAPTGVAAINAGGMTIHSLFQIPLGVHLPDVERNTHEQRRFKAEKIRLIRSLDLLVIDEISMVRADLLDAVDEVLRRFRDPTQPFGGVQLLMIGDLHQLPPVVKPEDWELLRRYYETPYFFSSRALGQTDYIAIELKHIYRQSDLEFIDLLNKVRDNRLDAEVLHKLNSRYIANFQPKADDAYITLTATNAVADEINAANLRRLPGAPRPFKAAIVGDFPAGAYPTEEMLQLKIGAQVMFIRNDTSPERRYFNGKIGTIVRFDEEGIHVRCPGDHFPIPVVCAEWQNVRYVLNEETKQIDEQILGTFTQYPLKLAWAITIHKSQGLTFDRAIIDAQAAFASGQVYVALSRCRTFEGIVLRSQIASSSVKTDQLVSQFSEKNEKNAPTAAQLEHARREYQITTIRELFDFQEIRGRFERLRASYAQHAASLPATALEQLQGIAERAQAGLFDVTRKFSPQLAEYLERDVMPEANEPLQERVRKASAYFTEKIGTVLDEVKQHCITSDNKEVLATLTSQLRSLRRDLFIKRVCFAACAGGFSTDVHHRAKVNGDLEFENSAVARAQESTFVPKDVPHPKLYRRLLEWRERMADQNDLHPRNVLPSATLVSLVARLPTNKTLLGEIGGIGKARLRRYGEELCAMIRNYRQEEKIAPGQESSVKKDAPSQPSTTSETKRLSFELFKQGKGLDEIASERRLTRATIEGHLAHFIGIGQLDVHSLLDQATVDEIQQFITSQPDATASQIKAHFGDKFGYGVIKMVTSHLNRHGGNEGKPT